MRRKKGDISCYLLQKEWYVNLNFSVLLLFDRLTKVKCNFKPNLHRLMLMFVSCLARASLEGDAGTLKPTFECFTFSRANMTADVHLECQMSHS